MNTLAPLLPLNQAPPSRPGRNGVSVMERLMRRTSLAPSGCWLYRGALGRTGYGRVFVSPESGHATAHRVVYLTVKGPIPDGLEIDHTCLTRNCLNPDHMRAVTHLENVRHGRTNQNHGKTHCIRGHRLPEDRICRPCGAAKTRAYRERVNQR